MQNFLVIAINFICLVLSAITSILFILLITNMKGWLNTGWWTVLPIAFIYTTILRAGVLLNDFGYLPTYISELLQAANLPFWLMIVIFAYGLCFTVMKTKKGV